MKANKPFHHLRMLHGDVGYKVDLMGGWNYRCRYPP